MEPEKVTFTYTVSIADADDIPIRKGDVLRDIDSGESGVVIKIMRAGDRGYVFDMVGDLKILTQTGITRTTNKYKQFRHVDKADQTYWERYRSWLVTPFHHDEYMQASKDEQIAMEGIFALLPEDAVNWEWESPQRIEDALKCLMRHLTELSNQKNLNPY